MALDRDATAYPRAEAYEQSADLTVLANWTCATQRKKCCSHMSFFSHYSWDAVDWSAVQFVRVADEGDFQTSRKYYISR